MEKLNIEPESKLSEFKETKETGPFRSNEEPIEEELKPMKNEQMILENPKIKGMDYNLAVEPI